MGLCNVLEIFNAETEITPQAQGTGLGTIPTGCVVAKTNMSPAIY